MESTIGVYGLGVMGRNLALNLEENNNEVSVYNRRFEGEEHVVSSFLKDEGHGKRFIGAKSVSDFVSSLETPRKILIMVKAGDAVDDVIEELLPFLEAGDILIDGGNSHFNDTDNRCRSLSLKNIHFVGMGISGGEEGARFGPSMMSGSTKEAWDQIKVILEPVAAKAFDGSPCCKRIGSGGAGHFVKMVHNGIEYADMQLIAEAFHFMKDILNMSCEEISAQLSEWNKGPLNSYLIEITSEILSVKDEDDNPLVEKILDSAGQKGTGKWTAITALESGIPLSGITGAVYSRFLSSLVDLRSTSPSILKGPTNRNNIKKNESLSFLEEALLACRIVCHAEGFFMIKEIDNEYNWGIDPADIAKVWQGGCIIRSHLLISIEESLKTNPNGIHLLLAPVISDQLNRLQYGWRNFISQAAQRGIPVPVMMSCLSQYDSIRLAKLPANLIQAQRDYFGAHTYERTDKARGEFFHTDWKAKAEKR